MNIITFCDKCITINHLYACDAGGMSFGRCFVNVYNGEAVNEVYKCLQCLALGVYGHLGVAERNQIYFVFSAILGNATVGCDRSKAAMLGMGNVGGNPTTRAMNHN